ncbi:hypothetical protein F5Y19DRAFT_120545 [Xylariaceae sp. FL1651]|nr:hypothetical protein F5Y19DRAFT_120545 [Xylariaceae sp. FL1651]
MDFDIVRRKKHCSYCGRSFARSEHLARHERSHRNERPYHCTLCDASFSRQDTFKRHRSRYHNQASIDTPSQQSQDDCDSEMRRPVPLEETQEPNSISTFLAVGTGLDSNATMSPLLLDPGDTKLMSGPMLDSGLPLSFDFGGLLGEAQGWLDIDLSSGSFASPLQCAPAPGSSLQVAESSTWKGSFAISAEKQRELVLEIDAVAPIQGAREFEYPTRFKFERFLNTFAECFLMYLPCIHTPTWTTEKAAPCMILAMASIGATYYEDEATSAWLYRIARASVKKYLQVTSRTIADEPLWIVQSVLLVMVNGSRSASFQHYQEAASLGSLLIEGIRYRKCLPYEPQLVESGTLLLDQWHRWIEHETTMRTICAVYVYFSALGVTFHTANAFCNLDMSDRFLPCEETEWTSPTPKAWLTTRQSNYKSPVRFSTAMASLSSLQSLTPLSLSTFGSYVTLHGIVKQLSSLHQDVWLLTTTPMLVQRFEQALDRWRIYSEQNPEFHVSPRYPNGVLPTNALSLYRQACIQLYADFGPLRSAFATRNVHTIVSSMKDINMLITCSSTCLKAAQCAIEALQNSVKLGLFTTGPTSGWHRKLVFNLYSLESCIFLSFWVRQQIHRSVLDRSLEENDLVKLTEETLKEIELGPIIAEKPYSIQVVYAWALVFQSCNASGLCGIVAKVLNIYADSLSE